MIVTFKLQERLLAWAAPRCDTHEWPKESVALGVIDPTGGRIRAVVVINARYGHTLAMHIASDGSRAWATEAVLRSIFTYAFDTLQAGRINAVIAERDIKTTIMALKLGFRMEGTLKSGANDGSDGILMRMLAQECPWIEHEVTPHGQEIPDAP